MTMPNDRSDPRKGRTASGNGCALWGDMCRLAGLTLLLPFLLSTGSASPKEGGSYISGVRMEGSFELSAAGRASPVCLSSSEYAGVLRAARDLQEDIHRVTDARPVLALDTIPQSKEILLIGTLGRNPLIDAIVREKKIDVREISGKWEAFLIQVVENPRPGVDRALIIAGSDKRGTIYGVYDLSKQIGVSPWYWWADVPVKKQSSLYVASGRYVQGEPRVQYRGIFINDEKPALFGWATEKFGGFNHRFYGHVFELILRLKGNYLWPAMWGSAFYDDDSLNAPIADEYGVVIGTSHHEPMMRAHDEWRRYGSGPWNFEKNADALKEFWRRGIQRMGSNESIVTVGMRGDGDEPMTAEANISLLERIVSTQRQILHDVTGKDVTTIPQLWALYKEVQEYYDKGMRVPDDITLLLCDDNWGNIRKLPRLNAKPTSGGYGIYYHFDYVGDPRNYKWLNTNQISRVWEQMHLAYEYGARKIWIVNVGDIKPMEFPLSFFLDYAWNPDQWPAEKLPEYTQAWAEQQFGKKYSSAIAGLLTEYTKFNSRRKPELLSPDTYSLSNYREAETVVREYNALAEKAKKISDALPPEYHDAFYQLVMHPIAACSNLNDLYVTVGRNHLYAQQGRALTNPLAARARALFAKDSMISYYYNNIMANGKWNHMMDQTHISYTYWQQPERDTMPEVSVITLPPSSGMGVGIEGSDRWWPDEGGEALLPECDSYNRQNRYIDIFNRGTDPLSYSVHAGQPWVRIDSSEGTINTEKRIYVSIDWTHAPSGRHHIPLTVSGGNSKSVVVQFLMNNPPLPRRNQVAGFIENNGYVSVEAEHYTQAVGNPTVKWLRIPDLGRTLSAMTTVPVTSPAMTPGGDGPRLEYQMYLFTPGTVKVQAYLSPTLNFASDSRAEGQGLRYAVSFDDEQPRVVNMHPGDGLDWRGPPWWSAAVSNNIRILTTQHAIEQPGTHVLKFWMVDPGVVLQKIVVDAGGMKPSYLGPPESFHQATAK